MNYFVPFTLKVLYDKFLDHEFINGRGLIFSINMKSEMSSSNV